MAKSNSDAEVKALTKRVKQLEKEVASIESSKNSSPSNSFNWRSPVVILCVLISGITFSTGAIAFAFNRTINDPVAYMRSVGPVIEQPEVQAALVKKSSEAIKQNIDIEQIVTDALPPKAAFLAGPITAQVNNQITNIISKFVASDRFANLWVKTNRQLHDSTLAFIKQSDGNPSIDVSQLYKFLSTELQGTPLSVVANKQLPEKVGVIKVTDAPWVPVAHQTLAGLSWIQNVGLTLSVLFGALAIYLSKKGLRTAAGLGLWIAGIFAVSLASLVIAQSAALQGITDSTYNAAAVAIWSTVLAPFYGYMAALISLALVATTLAWSTSDAKLAASIRNKLKTADSRVHNFVIRGHDNNQFFSITRKYRQGLEWLVLVVALGLILFVFRPVTVSIVLVTFAVGLLVTAVIEILAAE